MTFQYIDTGDFFSEPEGSISGVAMMDVETAYFNDSDIGGWDGVGVESCALVHVAVGPLCITRSQLVEAFSERMVSDFEDQFAEQMVEAAA